MLRIRVKNHHQIWILWLSTTWLQNPGVKLGHGGCPELRPASHQGNCSCASAHKPPQLPQDPGGRDMLRSPRHSPGCGTWLRAGFLYSPDSMCLIIHRGNVLRFHGRQAKRYRSITSRVRRRDPWSRSGTRLPEGGVKQQTAVPDWAQVSSSWEYNET